MEEIDENLKDSVGREEPGYSGKEGADGCIRCWEIGSSSIIFSSANIPIITQMRDKTNVYFGIRRSLGYGKNSTRKFEDNTLDIEKSTRIFLFSDGVVDERSETSGMSYGRKNLQNLLVEHKSSTLDELTLALKKNLSQWRNSRPRRDDLSFIAIEPI